ncbi:unnamed protein product [Urochloa decumbens]|uniref:Non-haem dioxygenase N-terminal domain-containing protein n=1 Tax=Urochloa decumbens TaxID=240449 RepID=A0ABC9GNV1_9POAL
MSGGRDEVRRAILDAGKEHGFFQVVGHGVPEQAIRDMEAVCHEFFEMPAADKAAFYSEDKAKPNRLFSGSSYETLGERYWRDCLRLVFPLPSGDTSGWPHKPLRLREVVANYAVLARGLAMEILRLLCEGMGLRRETTSMATSAAAVSPSTSTTTRHARSRAGRGACRHTATGTSSPCSSPAPSQASRLPTMATGSGCSPCQTPSSSTSACSSRS